MPVPENPNLIARDLQIIKLLALGLSRKDTAEKLGMTVKNLEFHLNGTENVRSIYSKLHVKHDTELVRVAIEGGMVKPGEKPAETKPAKPVPVEIKDIEDLKKAVLRGATLAASHSSDPLQINALVQCSDAYLRLVRTQMDAALAGRTLTP